MPLITIDTSNPTTFDESLDLQDTNVPVLVDGVQVEDNDDDDVALSTLQSTTAAQDFYNRLLAEGQFL